MSRIEKSKRNGKGVQKKHTLRDDYDDTEYEDTRVDRAGAARPQVLSQEVNDVVTHSMERAKNTQFAQEKNKKKRDPTTMNLFTRGPGQMMQVSFNTLGQPIGTNSKKLVSYLGVIARQHIPIVIQWKNIHEENWKTLKDDLWVLVK
ncbi:hypothetical protein MIMGU_mgv11b019429mg, partial [Erythranthe guttata]